jgi:hypothetical protein
MGRVSGQEQPSAAEPAGDAVLYPEPRGPGEAGDLRGQARFVQECLQFGGRDWRPRLPEWQLARAGGPGGEEPPGR